MCSLCFMNVCTIFLLLLEDPLSIKKIVQCMVSYFIHLSPHVDLRQESSVNFLLLCFQTDFEGSVDCREKMFSICNARYICNTLINLLKNFILWINFVNKSSKHWLSVWRHWVWRWQIYWNWLDWCSVVNRWPCKVIYREIPK